MKQIAIAAALTACVVSTGHAEILLTYDESAATPHFEISNDSACATGAMEVLIDLESSAAELFFDNRTTGTNLFDAALAPFRIESGADRVSQVDEPDTGSGRIAIRLSDMMPGESVSFSIDVDDQLDDGERADALAEGSRIAGAVAVVAKDGSERAALYGAQGAASVDIGGC